MRRASAIIIAALALSTPPLVPTAPGQEAKRIDYAAAWPPLIDRRAFQEARLLCEGWLQLEDRAAWPEAHKCLANVELSGARVRKPEDQPDSAPATPRYEGPGVDRALGHIAQAMAFAPDDVSIHMGRLVMLVRSGRFDDLPPALEESLRIYRGPDAFDLWVRIPVQLVESEQYGTALDLYQILEKRYPASPLILTGLGLALTGLQRTSEAIPYLRRAVGFAPNDPIANWNMARAYDLVASDDLAEVLYRKAISVQTDEPMLKEWSCTFAAFLEQKRGDRPAACELQKKSCPEGTWTACGPTLSEPAAISKEPGAGGQ